MQFSSNLGKLSEFSDIINKSRYEHHLQPCEHPSGIRFLPRYDEAWPERLLPDRLISSDLTHSHMKESIDVSSMLGGEVIGPLFPVDRVRNLVF
jgi:hypothetical protein